VLAVLGGALLSTAFPDLGLWPAAPVAIAVLLLAAVRDHAGWNLGVGWLSGLVFFLVQLQWADYAVGPVPWALLSGAEALAPGLVLVVWTWLRRTALLRRRPWLLVPVVATLWTGAEELRSVFPFGGFPWGRLAFSQATSPLAPLAWLGGAPLVSWVVCFVGAALALAVLPVGALLPAPRATRDHPAGERGTLARRAVAAAVAVGLVLVGLAVPLDGGAQDGTLRVGAVQGDVSHPGLHAFDQAREVLDNHLRGTYALAEQTAQEPLDVVLWPENGTDIDPMADASVWQQIDDASRAVGAPLLVGAVQYPSTGGRYNVGLLWEPGTGPVASYAKQHPVPFAEYVPWRSVARVFSSAVDLVRTDMLPGHRLGVLPLPVPRLGRTVRLGDVICFEVAIDSLVRGTVGHGAELLVVQTNNASFGPTAESTQQLAMTRLRAIETGRSAVQVSTVGVSAIVAPDGTTLASAGLFVPAQLHATVPLRTSLTPAVRWGGALATALWGLAALLTVAAVGSRARRDGHRRAGASSTVAPRDPGAVDGDRIDVRTAAPTTARHPADDAVAHARPEGTDPGA